MRKLIAVFCALLLAGAVGVAWYAQAPSWMELSQLAKDHPVASRPTDLEWNSPSLLAEMIKERRAAGEDTLVLMGSSELTMPAQDTMHPNVFYDKYDNGFGIMCIGLHGCHSLWQAIETAALDEQGAFGPKRKVALLVGFQWFYERGHLPEAFLNRFSEEALQECLSNPRLSQETKEQIELSVKNLGVSADVVESLGTSSIVASVNRVVTDLFDGSPEKRAELAASLKAQMTLGELNEAREPLLPWGDYEAIALQDAKEATSNNDLGLFDVYYDEYWPDAQANMESDDLPSFREWDENEFADLRLFIDVCQQLDIEPYMIIMPSMGAYYDNTHYDKESRDIWCGKLRDMFTEENVPYLDMTNRDNDKFYLRDVMHLAWKGWVEVDKALYDFYWSEPGEMKSGYATFTSATDESKEIVPEPDDSTLPSGETAAEKDADTAAEEVLEVEGAGKDVIEAQESAS